MSWLSDLWKLICYAFKAANESHLDPIPTPKPPDPGPVPTPEPPDPQPIPIPDHLVVIDLTTFPDTVRAAGFQARDSCIHYIFAAAIYGWNIPSTTNGQDSEYDGLMARYPEIQKYMFGLVDGVAAKMIANPGLTVTAITGDPNRPNYADIDLQGQKYAVGIQKRLELDKADMTRFELGTFTEGSI